MPRARWWVVGALSVVTLTVVTLDVDRRHLHRGGGAAAASSSRRPGAAGRRRRDCPPQSQPGPVAADPRVVREVATGAAGRRAGHLGSRPRRPARRALLTPGSIMDGCRAGDPGVHPQALDRDRRSSMRYEPHEPAATRRSCGTPPAGRARPGRWGRRHTHDRTRTARTGTASLAELAQATARGPASSRRRPPCGWPTTTRLFTGPSVSPAWEPTYVTSGVIAPVTALMTDQGRVTPDGDARLARPGVAALRQSFGDAARGGWHLRAGRRSARSRLRPTNRSLSGRVAADERPRRTDAARQRQPARRVAGTHGGARAGRPGKLRRGGAGAVEQAAAERGVDLGGRRPRRRQRAFARRHAAVCSRWSRRCTAASAEPQLASILSGLAVCRLRRHPGRPVPAGRGRRGRPGSCGPRRALSPGSLPRPAS